MKVDIIDTYEILEILVLVILVTLFSVGKIILISIYFRIVLTQIVFKDWVYKDSSPWHTHHQLSVFDSYYNFDTHK